MPTLSCGKINRGGFCLCHLFCCKLDKWAKSPFISEAKSAEGICTIGYK